MEYRTEALTLEKFINQLAVHYIGRGYHWYVTGWVPDGKDPREVDIKLVDKYGIAVSKYVRFRRRRRRRPGANLQYIRHGRFFCLLATRGQHPFYESEPEVRHCREYPIRYGGYSVSVRGGRVHVRLDRRAYNELKGVYVEQALRIRSEEKLGWELYRAPVEPYRGVYGQMKLILAEVNRVRRRAGGVGAGYLPVPSSRLRRYGRRPKATELIDARVADPGDNGNPRLAA